MSKYVAATLLVALAAPCSSQQGGDWQAQIEYAFQTEDLNQLSDLIEGLGSKLAAGGGDNALRYHLAHADYRFAEVAGVARADRAASALSDCVDRLKPLLESDRGSAEALALQAACYERLADYKKFQAIFLRAKAAERLRAAFALAPRNPRVLLIMAVGELASSKRGSPAAGEAFTRLQLAAQLFEDSSATQSDVPGWGHAEAYLALGHQLLLRADLLGARNWTERAMIAAPDYKAARRELAQLERR